jgi:hypothetical protein
VNDGDEQWQMQQPTPSQKHEQEVNEMMGITDDINDRYSGYDNDDEGEQDGNKI